MGMEGGFFLRKKPLSSMASVYTNFENAITGQKRKDVRMAGKRFVVGRRPLCRENVLPPHLGQIEVLVYLAADLS